MTDSPAVEHIRPVHLGAAGVHYSQGVKAGRWVFATGHMAQDFEAGFASAVVSEDLPHAGLPKREKEAALIFDRFQRVLAEAGTDLPHAVRTDQYYTSVQAVPAYQEVRRERFGALIPPSTSITMKGFTLPPAEMNVQMIAVMPDDDFTVRHLEDEGLKARPSSGYSPALVVGDYVFIPGNTGMAKIDEPRRGAMAEAALMENGMQWGGRPIKLETEFILNQRIRPALALAGSTMDDVVKAQVYLTDPDDYADFNTVWTRQFGAHVPATTVLPCAPQGLAPRDGTIEINILALRSDGKTVKQEIDAGVFPGFHHWPQAVRAGDLLCLSGLMAVDEYGIDPDAMPDERQPYYQDTVSAQADFIIANAAKICAEAGTSLENVVRIQQFHTDISDFLPVHQAWQRTLPDTPLPFSAVEIPGPLPVPGATVLMDIWVYAP